MKKQEASDIPSRLSLPPVAKEKREKDKLREYIYQALDEEETDDDVRPRL